MNLALVHYASSPVVGGVEQIMGAHARLFRQRGHDVLVCSQRGDAEVRIPKDGAVDDHLHVLRRAFARCEAVIVHNVMTMPFDLALTEALARVAGEQPQVRFMAWVHDLAACNPDLQLIPDLLKSARPGFEYIAVSDFRARQFRELTRKTCTVVPNGIDPLEILALPEAVARLVRERQLLDGRFLLLHPTRLLRRKNVEFGLEVIRAWKEQRIRGTLLITGAEDPHNASSRDYVRSLREECSRLEVSQDVIFVGEHFPIGADELAALYRLADALFLPSRQEGFGLPVLEAAVHRIPAFVADIESLREFPLQTTRRFSTEKSPADVARWIAVELREDAAREVRRRTIADYGWDNIYKRHLGPLLDGSLHSNAGT
jgi:glycosyltransferase involved in cell wall biosynthesis